MIGQKGTRIIMTADGTRGDISAMADDVINFTVTLVDSDNNLMTNNVGWYNNFSGAWVLHNTSASPLYNSTNLTGLTSGLYLFGGSFAGNTNYTSSGENWTLEVTDFNLTMEYSCGFPNFTYSNPSPAWLYNYTINLSYTGNYTNGTDLPLIDFKMVRLEQVRITNATGGERLTYGNYTVRGRTIIVRNESSYKNKLVNVTARYYYTTIVNLTQKAIEPRWQNTSCGIYTLTLNTAGSSANGTLKVKLMNPTNFSSWNITVRLNTNSNYTTALSLNNSTYITLINMTRGMSQMVWHWLDFNSTYPNKPLNHTIDFHMFTEGS
jgi:hypothetical protein